MLDFVDSFLHPTAVLWTFVVIIGEDVISPENQDADTLSISRVVSVGSVCYVLFMDCFVRRPPMLTEEEARPYRHERDAHYSKEIHGAVSEVMLQCDSLSPVT